jgi:hypothetical protein
LAQAQELAPVGVWEAVRRVEQRQEQEQEQEQEQVSARVLDWALGAEQVA